MTTTFTHAGRTWTVVRCLTEDETHEFVRLTTTSAPRPTREEYRAARAAYFAGRKSDR